MSETYNVTLHDKNDNNLAPRTHAQNVRMVDGRTVEVAITDLENKAIFAGIVDNINLDYQTEDIKCRLGSRITGTPPPQISDLTSCYFYCEKQIDVIYQTIKIPTTNIVVQRNKYGGDEWTNWQKTSTNLDLENKADKPIFSNRLKQEDINNNKGFLIKTSISFQNGMSFFIEIKGNAYASQIPINTIMQGYIYDNKIHISVLGAINLGYNISSINIFNLNNKICLWIDSDLYYSGLHVNAIMDIKEYGGKLENSVTEITIETKPTNISNEVICVPIQVATTTDLNKYRLLGVGRTSIPTGADLDTYVTSGSFAVTASSAVSSILNKPSDLGSAFSLDVIAVSANNYILQVIVDIYGAEWSRRVFINEGSKGSWNKKLSVAPNTGLDITFGGTGATTAANARTNLGAAPAIQSGTTAPSAYVGAGVLYGVYS